MHVLICAYTYGRICVCSVCVMVAMNDCMHVCVYIRM